MTVSPLLPALVDSGLTAQMLGIVSGLTDTRIAQLLHGDYPTPDEARVLSSFLQRSPADLFPHLSTAVPS